MEKIIFYSFGTLLLVSGLLMLLSNNLVRSVFLLFLTFFCIAVLIVFSGEDFLALSHLIVYVGGVLVLLIFTLMLSNQSLKEGLLSNSNFNWFRFAGYISAIIIPSFLLLYLLQKNASFIFTDPPTTAANSSIEQVGKMFLSKYAAPFEILSVLLLLILIAVAYIARKEKNID